MPGDFNDDFNEDFSGFSLADSEVLPYPVNAILAGNQRRYSDRFREVTGDVRVKARSNAPRGDMPDMGDMLFRP